MSSPEPKKGVSDSSGSAKSLTGQSKITDFVTRARKTLGSSAVAAKTRTSAAKNNIATKAAAPATTRKDTEKDTSEKSVRKDTQRDMGEKSRSTNGVGSETKGRARSRVAVVETPATRSGKRAAVSSHHSPAAKRTKVTVIKTTR